MIALTTNANRRATKCRLAPLCALLIATAGCATSSYHIFNFARTTPSAITVAQSQPTTTEAASPKKLALANALDPARPITSTSRVIPAALTQSASEEVPPPALSTALAPSIPETPAPPENACRLDMSTALALVAGQNPQVGYARWRIREAYANLEQANALWLPSIQAGVSYHHNEGTLQDSSGTILDVTRSSLQSGLGVGAVGAGTTPVPGIVAEFQLVDAIFQPAIAQRNAWAKEHARDAVLNDQLLEAAVAYQELLRAHQLRAIALRTVGGSQTLVRLTTDYANAGQGTRADADRSLAELSRRRNGFARSEEAVAVASARLAQVLSLKGAAQIVPVEDTITPIDLVASSCTQQDDLATALANRPELKESKDLVVAACERLRRERYAPLVPSVLVGASYGTFGGGPGDTLDDFKDHADFDARAYWQIRNLGFGEQSARQAANARLQEETMRQIRLMDTVAREVAESEARVHARAGLIPVAQSGIDAAQQSFDRNFLRIREAQGLPIEVLQSIDALDTAWRELVDATADFNIAQFQLQHALGWPVQRQSMRP